MAKPERRLSFERPSGDPPVDWMAGRRYLDRRPLPALVEREWELRPERQEVLLALYREVCRGWRTLTEVRFKLLGLVVAVSLGGVIALLARPEGLGRLDQTAVALVGLFSTFAVRLYDLRNTLLSNDLVGRGRQIETELGIHTGQFRGRPDPQHWLLRHDTAIWLVYTLSMFGWAFAAVAPWLTR